MAKKIREQDIFQEDIFANAKKSAEAYKKTLDQVTTELKELMQVNNKLIQQSANELKTTQAIKQRQQALQEVNKSAKALHQVEQEKLKTEQQLERLEQQRQRTAQSRLRTETQQRKEKERLEKIAKKELKQTQQSERAYSKLSKRLNELRNRYKDLAVEEKQNTREARNLKKEIDSLDRKLKSIDKSVGQSQRNVGNYTSVWGKLGMQLKSVASAFGVVGGVMGAVQLIKNATNIVIDFDSAIANLGAVSGASGEELDKLRNSALDLGESTKFTASEVAGLQLELAKLGFTTPEILDSTESILNLASATGTDLANASQIAGSTLRAFNLDASEMDRVASTLGVATTKSALNMEFLQTAMSKVAPVSSALGFSIEDTTALLGGLANAGFDASTSATSTRNILLKLADSGGDLAQALGRPVKNLPDLVAGLRELDASGVDLAESLELTDKRSVAAFQTFLKNTDTLVELKEGITDVNDELAEMSEKQLDTVAGQLALLNSKWQGMILGTSNSAGAVTKLKNAIKFLTNNLGTILTIGGKVVKWLLLYKGTMIAVNLVNKTATSLFGGLTTAITSSGNAFKKLGTLIKANPIGLLIGAMITLNELIDQFGRKTEEMIAKGQELAKKRIDEISTTITKNLEIANKKADEQIKKGNLVFMKGVQLRAELTNKVYDEEIENINKLIAKRQQAFKNAMSEPRERSKLSGELEELEKKLSQLREIRENNYKTILNEQYQIKLKQAEASKKENDVNKKGTKDLINLLTELKKKRAEIERQRTNELLSKGQTQYFGQLTKTSNELAKQIKYYEDILKGAEKVQKRGIKFDEKREETTNNFASALQGLVPTLQDQAKKENEILQERIQAYQRFTQEIIRLIDKRTDKQIEAINKELDASKKRQEELTALAIQGTTDATQSLATEQKRQAELERQKAELEKRKLRRQTILSGIELLSNKLDNNEGDAVASTIRDITGLISILSNLPAFAEGSEYIERGDAPKGKDTILARVNEGERILTTEQNRKLGNVSNEELTKIVEHHNKGIFDDTNYLQPKVKNLHAPFQSTSMLLGKFDELKRAIEQKPMLTEVRWDEVSKMIVEKVETKNKITKNHQSTKGLF